MKRIFTRLILIASSPMLVLLTLCLLETQARGQGQTYVITFQGSLGLASGQTIRVTQANLMEAEGPGQTPVELFVRPRLYDTQGAVIAESAEVRIPSQKFHSFNFNRGDLHVAGEPGTSRLQVLVSIEVRSAGGTLIIRDARALDPIPSSLEIVDNSTGVTTVSANSNKPLPWFSLGPAPISGFGTDFLIGIVPGQMLRFSVFNPSTSIPGPQLEPLRGHVKIFDSGGGLIAQSPEVVIPPGEFRSIDFNRGDLPLLGEAGTGRLQGRGKIILWVRDANPNPARFAPVSIELVNQVTGRTEGFFGGVRVAVADIRE